MKYTMWLLIGLMISVPSSHADDITDAMLDIDPRPAVTSGTGMVLDTIFAPKEVVAPSDDALNPDEVPTISYRHSKEFEGFRSPLYEDQHASEPLELDTLLLDTEEPVPLGQPYQREGVHYQDDLSINE